MAGHELATPKPKPKPDPYLRKVELASSHWRFNCAWYEQLMRDACREARAADHTFAAIGAAARASDDQAANYVRLKSGERKPRFIGVPIVR